jgi:hypothetical protein
MLSIPLNVVVINVDTPLGIMNRPAQLGKCLAPVLHTNPDRLF